MAAFTRAAATPVRGRKLWIRNRRHERCVCDVFRQEKAWAMIRATVGQRDDVQYAPDAEELEGLKASGESHGRGRWTAASRALAWLARRQQGLEPH